jgi:hypothetical protein
MLDAAQLLFYLCVSTTYFKNSGQCGRTPKEKAPPEYSREEQGKKILLKIRK